MPEIPSCGLAGLPLANELRSAVPIEPPWRSAANAAVHGYTVAFWIAAGVFAVGAVVVGLLMHSITIEADAAREPTGDPQPVRS